MHFPKRPEASRALTPSETRGSGDAAGPATPEADAAKGREERRRGKAGRSASGSGRSPKRAGRREGQREGRRPRGPAGGSGPQLPATPPRAAPGPNPRPRPALREPAPERAGPSSRPLPGASGPLAPTASLARARSRGSPRPGTGHLGLMPPWLGAPLSSPGWFGGPGLRLSLNGQLNIKLINQ